MKNTRENKQRFMAQYWGQEVGVVNEANEHKIFVFDGSHLYSYLMLKPLSQITDEASSKFVKRNPGGVWLLNTLDDDYAAFLSTATIECYHDNDQSLFTESDNIDFLRSKGYALPWMGISVEQQIERGWVKLTNS